MSYTLSIHGGDIYEKDIRLDFSVNINAFGPDPSIVRAMHDAVGHVTEYPEYGSGRLKRKLADVLGIDEDWITLTNGASEAFIAITQGLKPRTGIVQSPSFYGYTYALQAAGALTASCEAADIKAYAKSALDSDAEMIFIADPNNPTGERPDAALVRELAVKTGEQGRHTVIDECFLPLTGEDGSSLINSLSDEAGSYAGTVIVRSFTKTFAIPGIRLGYCVCTDAGTNRIIRSQLPEWNISNIAQEAGMAALDCIDTVTEQIRRIGLERVRLAAGLSALGLVPADAKANFLLFRGPEDLKERLLSRGILIRDCSNFSGLGKGYFRTAVLRPEEDDELLDALRAVLER